MFELLLPKTGTGFALSHLVSEIRHSLVSERIKQLPLEVSLCLPQVNTKVQKNLLCVYFSLPLEFLGAKAGRLGRKGAGIKTMVA